MKKQIISLLATLFLVGCGGGSSSSGNQTISGVLLDSAISGVSYSCDSTSGITDLKGTFTCPINSTVTFKIGSVKLGSMKLSSSQNLQYIIPAKLYGLENNNITDKRVLNFIQFVQSLDADNNATNGINITSEISESLVGYNLDISDTNTIQDDVNTTLNAIGKILIPQSKALKHYKDTLASLNIAMIPEPYYYQQWYLDRNDTFYMQNGIDYDANIHVGNLLNRYTGKGVKIAVIDDGLDMAHEDLKGAIINSYDISTRTTDVSADNLNHGTAVTGIIGARVNAKGIQGVASESEIIFLKYKTEMSDSEIIELFNKAEEFGADIINCSWGTYDVSPAVKDKIVDLAKNGRNGKGIIIVFAAGNDNQDMGNDESAIPEVISVSATNKDNLRTGYSNYGSNLDVVAPGGYYWGITTLDNMGSSGEATIDENYLLYNDSNSFAGTSASAPIVSGAIALMLEKNPNLTRVEVENILKNSSDKIGSIEYINGRNDYYGYGKINLTKMMEN